jgi:hypothetical protein
MISRFPVTSISARILSILVHRPRCRGLIDNARAQLTDLALL